MRIYIFFAYFLFFILTSYGDSILNHVSIEKDIYYLDDIKESCAETCIYFILANNQRFEKYTYDNIKTIFDSKYGKRPYNMLQIKLLMEDLGITSIAKHFKNKEDIFKFTSKLMIIYFPPFASSPIGHFSFVLSHDNGEFYLVDPVLGPNKIIKFEKNTIFFKEWSGIALIVGKDYL